MAAVGGLVRDKGPIYASIRSWSCAKDPWWLFVYFVNWRVAGKILDLQLSMFPGSTEDKTVAWIYSEISTLLFLSCLFQTAVHAVLDSNYYLFNNWIKLVSVTVSVTVSATVSATVSVTVSVTCWRIDCLDLSLLASRADLPQCSSMFNVQFRIHLHDLGIALKKLALRWFLASRQP